MRAHSFLTCGYLKLNMCGGCVLVFGLCNTSPVIYLFVFFCANIGISFW